MDPNYIAKLCAHPLIEAHASNLPIVGVHGEIGQGAQVAREIAALSLQNVAHPSQEVQCIAWRTPQRAIKDDLERDRTLQGLELPGNDRSKRFEKQPRTIQVFALAMNRRLVPALWGWQSWYCDFDGKAAGPCSGDIEY